MKQRAIPPLVEPHFARIIMSREFASDFTFIQFIKYRYTIYHVVATM